LQFTTNAPAPTVTSPGTIVKNLAKVSGAGVAGRTIYLYADGIRIGSTTNGGTFTVLVTRRLKSGSHALAVTQADDKNAESDAVAAGTVTVPPPLAVTSTALQGNTARINGTGQAGLTVKVCAC
jgi:hypothetical protein